MKGSGGRLRPLHLHPPTTSRSPLTPIPTQKSKKSKCLLSSTLRRDVPLSPRAVRLPNVVVAELMGVAGGVKERGRNESLAPRKKASSVKDETVHEVRMLVARYAQWRFVNSRAQKAADATKSATERRLFGTWLRLWEIRKLVAAKRRLVQMARNQMKLHGILIPQIQLLTRWEKTNDKTMNAVADSAAVLNASCIRVPFTDGAQVDVEDLQNAIHMAVSVMMELEVMLARFHDRMGKTSSLVHEMVEVLKQEIEKMEELTKIVRIVAVLEQIHETSLRASLVQLLKQKEMSNFIYDRNWRCGRKPT